MNKTLNVSSELHLPLNLITETIAILAKRGVGKTYTASVITEEIVKAGGHVVVIDPVGVWWGLRASASGDAAGGLQVLILGGTHGDLPLDPGSGRTVANIIVSERLSCVLDLSLMSQEEFCKFLAPFLECIYQNNREALHLVVDEADAVAPQAPGRGEAPMLAALDRIVRRGRARGLGVTLITQRPAVLNKNVLTQIELLVIMRLTSPNDRKAIDSWIQAHGTAEEHRAVIESLSKLDVGEAWFWSPAWLNLLQRVRVRRRETFDSSATPTVGQTLSQPRSLASVDLQALQKQFHAALKIDVENDPEQLRRQIDLLHRRLLEQPSKTVVEQIKVPTLDQAEVERLEKAAANMVIIAEGLIGVAQEIRAVLVRNANDDAGSMPVQLLPALQTIEVSQQKLLTPVTKAEPNALSAPQQRILDALAAFATYGLASVARSNVAVWAEQSPSSSGYANNLGRLRTARYIDYPVPGYLTLTEEGKQQARVVTPLRSISELHQTWLLRLSRPQGRILTELWSCYPASLSRSQLAERANQSPTSSGFSNNLGALRSLGLIQYPSRGYVGATSLAFPQK